MWFTRATGCIGNDTVHYPEWPKTSRFLIVVSTMVAILFGSVHLLAWNLQFPNKWEQIGWRIACMLMVMTPIPICTLMIHVDNLESGNQERSRRLAITVLSMIVIGLEALYVCARGFIFVEAVRSLWFLPSRAFLATGLWNVPHIG